MFDNPSFSMYWSDVYEQSANAFGNVPVSYLAAPGSGSQVIPMRSNFAICRCPYLVVGTTVSWRSSLTYRKPNPRSPISHLYVAVDPKSIPMARTSTGTAPAACTMSAKT